MKSLANRFSDKSLLNIAKPFKVRSLTKKYSKKKKKKKKSQHVLSSLAFHLILAFSLWNVPRFEQCVCLRGWSGESRSPTLCGARRLHLPGRFPTMLIPWTFRSSPTCLLRATLLVSTGRQHSNSRAISNLSHLRCSISLLTKIISVSSIEYSSPASNWPSMRSIISSSSIATTSVRSSIWNPCPSLNLEPVSMANGTTLVFTFRIAFRGGLPKPFP